MAPKSMTVKDLERRTVAVI